MNAVNPSPAFGRRMKAIAFWAIIFWITLISILISLMIWNAVDRDWVMRIIWTATTLTIGTLLVCMTTLGFAAAEQDGERRRQEATSASTEPETTATHLRDALERAKQDATPKP